jgi:hypothetical protein
MRSVGVAALMLEVLASGCSFSLVHGPPDTPARRCTDKEATPVLDVVAGLPFLVVGTIVLASAGDSSDPPLGQAIGTGPLVAIGITSLVLGALFETSATVGLRRVNACRSFRSGSDAANGPGH